LFIFADLLAVAFSVDQTEVGALYAAATLTPKSAINVALLVANTLGFYAKRIFANGETRTFGILPTLAFERTNFGLQRKRPALT